MGYSLNISLVLALCMAILHLSHTQDTSPGNAPDDYLNAHSCTRKVMDLPALKWDPELAKSAQAWADQRKDCQMIRSDRCGENMASGQNLNGSYAVQMWLDEKRNYDYGENKCVDKMCGRYTQCIWKKTERVGCGKSTCEDGSAMVVCHYDPPGNIVGEKPF